MGDFSRDTFDKLKHFVGVRLQQGVPLLDADWNEQEDNRKFLIESFLKWFIGNGIPVGNDGFRIIGKSYDNDFLIKGGDGTAERAGRCLAKGKDVIIESDIKYTEQELYMENDLADEWNVDVLPALAKPPSGSDRTDLVYLDIWEREVDSVEDPDLVNPTIGVETCVRKKREWVVRVAEGKDIEDLPEDNPPHFYYPLALITRKEDEDAVESSMITDLRRINLTLADNTKAPLTLFDGEGNVTYDLEDFSELLGFTRDAYFNLLQSDLFMNDYFASASPFELAIISAVFNEVMQIANSGAMQANIRNLDNKDGVKILEMLYYAQSNFVTEIGELITSGDDIEDFLDDIEELLDGSSGLKEAVITQKDLKSGIDAQDAINKEIGNRTQILPHGDLVVQFVSGPAPGTVIETGKTYSYEFDVKYEQTTPQSWEETFDVRPSMSPVGWAATIDGQSEKTITLQTGETTKITVDVAIPGSTALTSATLELNVRSQHNPAEMDVTNSDVVLELGSTGPQPNPLFIELLSPSLVGGVLNVGRGGPFGAPGKGVYLNFRFSYSETVATPEAFTVSFVSTPAATFEDIGDVNLELGSTAGQQSEQLIGFQATAEATNGTTGTLTVRIEKDSDSEVFYELVINLNVNKA